MRLSGVLFAALALWAAPVAAQNATPEGRYGTGTLQVGFEPDPQSVAVRSGGTVDVSQLGPECVGYVDSSETDYVLDYEAGQYIIAFFVEAEADTYADATLMISERHPFPETALADGDLGDDAGEYARDGECDDPRFGGILESHRGHDATDCAAAAGAAAGPGDDSGTFAFDGACDDPRYGGELESHRGHDATDCARAARLGSDLGDDSGAYARDGECDDPRFGGGLPDHLGRDATDCAGGPTRRARGGDSSPPVIEVAEVVSTETGAAEIAGRVSDDVRVRRLTVDERSVPFDAEGNFRVLRQVEVGSHEIVVTAEDSAGNTSRATVTVQSMDTTPPIVDMVDLIETSESRVRIAGIVLDRSAVAMLVVGDRVVAVRDNSFEMEHPVPMGETIISVVAVDEWGNRSERAVRVVRRAGVATAVPLTPPQPAPPQEQEPDVPALPERRTALVIGNSTYPESPLRNPENVAGLVADALRSRGFEVIELLNASQRDMRLAIIEFGDLLAAGGVGLFYYAGHGMQVGGENFLIPIDAQISREAHVAVEGVSANQVLARMDGARNPLNIVILDACRNNPFARAFRSSTAGLAQMQAPTGTYIAYATAPGDVAKDGDGDNSPFSAALAQAVALPGLSLEETFKEVRRAVRESTGGSQTPWTSSSVLGDFLFRPGERRADKARK